MNKDILFGFLNVLCMLGWCLSWAWFCRRSKILSFVWTFLLALTILALLCSSQLWAATLNYTTGAGKMSDGTKWSTSTSPCTTGGDGVYVSIKHAMVFDCSSLGSSATGLASWRIESGGSLCSYDGTDTTCGHTSTQGAQTIWLASTGNNCIGSGSTTNPGSDATCIGLFISYGTFNFIGDVSDQLTVKAATAGEPIYIAHVFSGYSGGTGIGTTGETGGAAQSTHGSAFYCSFCTWKVLGNSSTTAAIGEGINYSLRAVEATPASSFDIENYELDSPYEVVTASSVTNNASFTMNDGWINAPTGQYFILWTNSTTSGSGFTFTNNLETGATTTGQTAKFVNRICALTWTGNVTIGNAAGTVQRGQHIQTGGSACTSGVNWSVQNNLVLNAEGTVSSTSNAFDLGFLSGDSTSLVKGNIVQGSYVAYHSTNGSTSGGPTFSNNWGSVYTEAAAGQGVYEAQACNIKSVNNIAVLENSTGNNIAVLYYSGPGCNTTNGTGIYQIDNSTIYFASAPSASTEGINIGDTGGATVTSGSPTYLRSSIVVNAYVGILNNAANVWSTGGTYSIGPSNNMVYNFHTGEDYCGTGITCGTPSHGSGTGWDDGTHYHPNYAYYGDLAGVNPQFVDVTRRPLSYSTFCGGAGTPADLGTQYSYRNGLGAGTYNHCYDIPSMLAWMQAGFQPMNLQLNNAGYGGAVQVGAVPVSVGAIL